MSESRYDDSADRMLFQILMQDPHFREEIELLYEEKERERDMKNDREFSENL